LFGLGHRRFGGHLADELSECVCLKLNRFGAKPQKDFLLCRFLWLSK
jgi:hypothetical protein